MFNRTGGETNAYGSDGRCCSFDSSQRIPLHNGVRIYLVQAIGLLGERRRAIRRDPDGAGDVLARQALAAQRDHPRHDGRLAPNRMNNLLKAHI